MGTTYYGLYLTAEWGQTIIIRNNEQSFYTVIKYLMVLQILATIMLVIWER